MVVNSKPPHSGDEIPVDIVPTEPRSPTSTIPPESRAVLILRTADWVAVNNVRRSPQMQCH
jgi:hypothetical protein